MKRYFNLFIALGFSATLSAQQVNSELQELIRSSFTYFPRLQEAEQSVTVAGQKVDLVKTGYVPSMNAGFTYNYISPVGEATFPTGPGTTQTIQFQPNHNLNGNIGLNYIVYDFGRLQANIRKSKEELQLNKDNLEFQRVQLASQVCQFYYGMIYLQRSIAIEDSLIAVLSENKRMVQSRLDNGDALQLDLLNIESSLGQEEMRRIDLRNNYERQLIFLEYLTGLRTSPSVGTFDYAVTEQQDSYFLDKAKTANYEFIMANDRLNMIRSDLRFNRSQFLPYLNLNAGAGFRNGYQPDINEMRFNYALGGGITIPILDAVKTKQQVRITKTLIRQQEISLVSLENTYRKDINLVLADIRSGREKLETMNRQITASAEALRIARVRYANGSSTYLDLINAAYTLQKVQLQKVQIEYNICLANIELARLSGVQFY